MPIYEYQCQHCGERTEAIQKFSDAPLTECPCCHQATLNRLVSAPRFQLKGTGWYETDFKDKPKKPTVQESEKKPEKSKKNKESKSD